MKEQEEGGGTREEGVRCKLYSPSSVVSLTLSLSEEKSVSTSVVVGLFRTGRTSTDGPVGRGQQIATALTDRNSNVPLCGP